MSLTGGGRGGAPARALIPGTQRRAVMAVANLFEISLDHLGRIVYQYDGSSFHFFSFSKISNRTQLVSGSLACGSSIFKNPSSQI